MLDTLPFSTNVKKAAKDLLPLAFFMNVAIVGIVGCQAEEALPEPSASSRSVHAEGTPVPLYTNAEMIHNAQYTYTQFRRNMTKPDSALDIILETNVALEITNADKKKTMWLEAARRECKTYEMSREQLLKEFIRLAQDISPTPGYMKTGDQTAVYFMALLAEYAESKKR